MKWNDVSDNWAAFVPRIMTRWPDVNENEVLALDGNQDALYQQVSFFHAKAAPRRVRTMTRFSRA